MLYSISTKDDKEARETVEKVVPDSGTLREEALSSKPLGIITIVIL